MIVKWIWFFFSIALFASTFTYLPSAWDSIRLLALLSTVVTTVLWWMGRPGERSMILVSKPLSMIAEANSFLWLLLLAMHLGGQLPSRLSSAIAAGDQTASRLSVRAMTAFSVALLLTRSRGAD